MPTATPLSPITEVHLRLLRVFRAVAEAGGLTAAEARLGMERSTISRHLQALEAKLGARLCYRGPSGFALTAFGRTALQVAITAGDVLDRVRDELELARDGVGGDLHLGVADICLSNPACRVHEAVAAFRDKAPGATLHLTVSTPDKLRCLLAEGRLHIGISGTVLGNAQIRQQALFAEPFALCVGLAPQQAVPAMEELHGQAYVLVTRENDYRTLNLSRRLKLDRHAVALGLEAVATLVAAGGYVGFLPRHLMQAMAPIHRFAEVRNSEAVAYTTRFSMVTALNHRLPAAGQLLAGLLTKVHGAGWTGPVAG